MQQKTRSLKFLKKRKFLTILPLLVLPFLLVFFMALGGGKGSLKAETGKTATGLNLKLPDAHFKKGKEADKMGLYELAGKESKKLRDALKKDPYYKRDSLENHSDSMISNPGLEKIFRESASKFQQQPGAANNEEKVMEKLAQLRTELAKKPELKTNIPDVQTENPEIRKLTALMSQVKNQSEPNPEISRISNMLDKVMAIQHPELLQDSLSRIEAQYKKAVYSVSLNSQKEEPATFGATEANYYEDKIIKNRFYDLVENEMNDNDSGNLIEAIIPETQTIVSGSTIKLRLLNDIRIGAHVISKNQFIYGVASLNNERLKIQFSSIRSGNNIFPVALDAYDMDGLAGIFIPGSMNRDIAKQSGDQALGTLGIGSLDPSIGAQAAGAGIQAAKTLLSRKVKMVKVTIKAGYKVFLKDSNQK
jgi:conjugative transposon TraM protein